MRISRRENGYCHCVFSNSFTPDSFTFVHGVAWYNKSPVYTLPKETNMMKNFSLNVNGDVYQVSLHPDINNFLIVRHQTGEHRMMKLPNDKWKCINDNPFCSYIPINDINCMVREKLTESSGEPESLPVGMHSNERQSTEKSSGWLNILRSLF